MMWLTLASADLSMYLAPDSSFPCSQIVSAVMHILNHFWAYPKKKRREFDAGSIDIN